MQDKDHGAVAAGQRCKIEAIAGLKVSEKQHAKRQRTKAFENRILRADRVGTVATLAAKPEPTEHGDVVIPGEFVIAFGAG